MATRRPPGPRGPGSRPPRGRAASGPAAASGAKPSRTPPDKRAAGGKPRAHGGAAANARGSPSGTASPDSTPQHNPPTSIEERTAMNRILLVDLGEREHKTREELRGQKLKFDSLLRDKQSGGLNNAQQRDYDGIVKKLKSDATTDPFYRLVASTVLQRTWDDLATATDFDYVHLYGLMGSQRVPAEVLGKLQPVEREIAGIAGLLQLDNHVDYGRDTGTLVRHISTAQGEYRANRALFDAAFEQLCTQYEVRLQTQIDAGLIDADIVGCEWPGEERLEHDGAVSTDRDFRPSGSDRVCALSARNVAATVRRLAANGVTANDPWLASHIQNGYDMQAGVLDGAPISSVEISLPEFDESTDQVAVRENLLGAQAVAFAAHCEDMNMFQVVEKCVDLFRMGLLPISRGNAGNYLYGYLKKSAERMTQNERLDLYRQVLGRNEGDPSMPGNREFRELWLRFIAAVSNFGRQLSVDRLLRTSVPVAVSQEQVRKAGRDLAANLSVHSFGIVRFAAGELQQTILEFRDVLSDPELRGCVGARDMWQLIDQVNANYLGGLRNTHQHRTQARSSAVIIRWLANHSDRLSGRYGEVINVNALTNPQISGSDQPMVTPNDWDLVQACHQWLAVSGVQDASIEQYSQSVESPVIPSRPVGGGHGLPADARAILDQAGIALPAL